MKILCADWLHMRWLLHDNHRSGFFKMAASRFVEVTDEGIVVKKMDIFQARWIHLAFGE